MIKNAEKYAEEDRKRKVCTIPAMILKLQGHFCVCYSRFACKVACSVSLCSHFGREQ